MKTFHTIFLTISISTLAFSQNTQTDSLSKAKIKALAFMVGNWRGEGWMAGRDGRSEFDQTEEIQFKLDSTAILIEGRGTSDGKVVHNALAILTYNKKDDNYVMRSYLPSGLNADFKAEIIEGKLHWYPNENVRYIISLNESGQWSEMGEYNREGNWSQFFEMTLNKEE